jgi:hypothetical protein
MYLLAELPTGTRRQCRVRQSIFLIPAGLLRSKGPNPISTFCHGTVRLNGHQAFPTHRCRSSRRRRRYLRLGRHRLSKPQLSQTQRPVGCRPCVPTNQYVGNAQGNHQLYSRARIGSGPGAFHKLIRLSIGALGLSQRHGNTIENGVDQWPCFFLLLIWPLRLPKRQMSIIRVVS